MAKGNSKLSEPREVVGRQDISGLSKEQQRVMNRAYDEIEEARTHTVDEWALREVTTVGGYTIDDLKKINYKPITEWDRYRHNVTQEEAINDILQRSREYARKFGNYYEDAKSGVVLTHASTNTLRALENRGFIEIVNDGKRHVDTIRIIEKKKR